MAVTKATQRRLMDERARALATLLLTRRPDVLIQDVVGEIGVDLLVQFAQKKDRGLRQFGVELMGSLDPVDEKHANKVVRPVLRAHREYGPFPFPVVLFFFTMRIDAGWYTWVAEPVISPDGRAHLPLRDDPDCRPLDQDAVNEILDQVNSWYDAYYDFLSNESTDDEQRNGA